MSKEIRNVPASTFLALQAEVLSASVNRSTRSGGSHIALIDDSLQVKRTRLPDVRVC